MTNTKTTKRALLASVLSVVMCISMLIGSTFAWFTDTASTNVNKIQAGTLDVVLEVSYDNGANWEDANGKTLDFIAKDGNKDILWEPGCTYELPLLRVRNEGNLWLKYQIAITGIKGDAKLNEAIDWKNGTNALDLTTLNTWTALAPKGTDGNTSANIKIVGHMKEEAGNEYQGLSIEGIAITVFATQFNKESDSFTPDYDKNAPDLEDEDGNILIGDAVSLFAFANKVNSGNNYAGKTVLLTADIDLAGYNWTPIGNVNAYPGVTFAGTFNGRGHTISNMYAVDKTVDYASAGFFGSITGKVQNLTIDKATVISTHYAGGIVGFSSANVGMKVENCKVTNSTITSVPELKADGNYDNGDKAGGIIGYMVSGDVVIDCTVENTTVTAYRDLGGIAGNCDGTLTNNKVNKVTLIQDNTNGYKSEAITTVGEFYGRSANNEVSESDNTATSVKKVVVVKVEGAPAGLKINLVKKEGLTYADSEKSSIVVSNYNSLRWAVENQAAIEAALKNNGITITYLFGWTVKLDKDIDLGGDTVKPMDASWFAGFDGNGHTISNVKIEGGTDDAQLGFFSNIGKVENVTFKNVTVTTSKKDAQLGVVASFVRGGLKNVHVDGFTLTATGDAQATAYMGGLVSNCYSNAENCTVKNGTINGGKNVGAIFGFMAADTNDASTTLALTNLTATDVTISAPNNADRTTVGQLFGRLSTPRGNITVTGCTATNVVKGNGENLETVKDIYGDLGAHNGTVTIDGQTKSN